MKKFDVNEHINMLLLPTLFAIKLNKIILSHEDTDNQNSN